MNHYNIHFEQCYNGSESDSYNLDWHHICMMSYSVELCHLTTLLKVSDPRTKKRLTSRTKEDSEQASSVWLFTTKYEIKTIIDFAITMRDTIQNAKQGITTQYAGHDKPMPYDKLIHMYNLIPDIFALLQTVSDTKCRMILVER